ncbi:MAG: GNAT family N-acetyltransferase [Phycisphaerales bacterium]
MTGKLMKVRALEIGLPPTRVNGPANTSSGTHMPASPETTRKFSVRLMDGRDSISDLTELLHRAYKRHADRGMRVVAAYQDEALTAKRIRGGECYLAVLRDDPRKVVGTIVFKDPAHTSGTPWFDRADVASFSQLAVEPWLQGRGLGGMLIAQAESRAVETGAGHIALSTPEPATELVAMYRHKGYALVEPVQWPGTNYQSLIMSKPAVRRD